MSRRKAIGPRFARPITMTHKRPVVVLWFRRIAISLVVIAVVVLGIALAAVFTA